MKSFCVKQSKTGDVFKVLLSEEELQAYLQSTDDVELVDCTEYDDAPSMVLEN